MASLAETRDSETGNHIRRTSHYVKVLAEKLCTDPRFGYFLTDKKIELLFKSAPLHDIRKIGCSSPGASNLQEEFVDIARRYADTDEDMASKRERLEIFQA